MTRQERLTNLYSENNPTLTRHEVMRIVDQWHRFNIPGIARQFQNEIECLCNTFKGSDNFAEWFVVQMADTNKRMNAKIKECEKALLSSPPDRYPEGH